jgi:hypothetical protein
MKNLKLRLLLLCMAVGLTLGLSHAVAQAAACVNVEMGATVYGNYYCSYVGGCGGWCYYDCKCSNLFPGYTCDNVLEEAGFELGATPNCQLAS